MIFRTAVKQVLVNFHRLLFLSYHMNGLGIYKHFILCKSVVYLRKQISFDSPYVNCNNYWIVNHWGTISRGALRLLKCLCLLESTSEILWCDVTRAIVWVKRLGGIVLSMKGCLINGMPLMPKCVLMTHV